MFKAANNECVWFEYVTSSMAHCMLTWLRGLQRCERNRHRDEHIHRTMTAQGSSSEKVAPINWHICWGSMLIHFDCLTRLIICILLQLGPPIQKERGWIQNLDPKPNVLVVVGHKFLNNAVDWVIGVIRLGKGCSLWLLGILELKCIVQGVEKVTLSNFFRSLS